MGKYILEACVDSAESAAAAVRGGADRLELCANLIIGGTTPEQALYEKVRELTETRIHVLIRPRYGDFLYTEHEFEIIARSVELYRNLGADGVVVGCLLADGGLDRERMERLRELAGPMHMTLHRAFDMTRDPFAALETAVRLGCTTILTSGQAPSAPAGQDLLQKLFQQAAGRLDLMAGAGVKKDNIRELFTHTGIRVFHTSGRTGPADSGMTYRKETVSMGLPSLSEYELWRTDEDEFRACAELVHSLPDSPPIIQ